MAHLDNCYIQYDNLFTCSSDGKGFNVFLILGINCYMIPVPHITSVWVNYHDSGNVLVPINGIPPMVFILLCTLHYCREG